MYTCPNLKIPQHPLAEQRQKSIVGAMAGIGMEILSESMTPSIVYYTPASQPYAPIIRTPLQSLVSVDFEVHGVVQGCFFLKFCSDQAKTLGLKGWVRNTRKGTILGKMQGEKQRVDDMAMWLRLQGSPGCRIQECVFRNWTIIDGHADFKEFRALY